MDKKTYGLPAFLSFIMPGIGQLLKGEFGKGLGMLFCYMASIIMCWYWVGFILLPIVWMNSVYDAYNAQV